MHLKFCKEIRSHVMCSYHNSKKKEKENISGRVLHNFFIIAACMTAEKNAGAATSDNS